MLMAPWSMMLASGYSRETSNGYEKATTLAGHPGDREVGQGPQARRAERLRRQAFMVTIEGHDLDDIKTLHEFASNFNVASLQ